MISPVTVGVPTTRIHFRIAGADEPGSAGCSPVVEHPLVVADLHLLALLDREALAEQVGDL
ncbi:hypothetical protein ACU4GA_17715 [Methylobacterium oryzae CBMB20]